MDIRELLSNRSDATTAQVAAHLPEICEATAESVLTCCAKLTIPVPMKAKLVAALWMAEGGRPVLRRLLSRQPDFACPMTLRRASDLLDAPRKMRLLERKLAATSMKRARRVRMREALQTLATENVPAAFSASRSFCRLVRRQLAKVPAERLEFDLLFYADGPWQALCDLAHPRSADWSLPFFQPTVFGAPPPDDSLLANAKNLSAANVVELIERHPRLAVEGYSFVRSKLPVASLPPAAKAALVSHCLLGDVIWHYEELRSVASNTDSVVEERLRATLPLGGLSSRVGDVSNFAKIVERLLTFRRMGVSFWGRLMPLAERLLEELKTRRTELVRQSGVRTLQALAALALDGSAERVALPEAVAHSVPTEPSLRVAVLGDASASMQSAINAACIAGAMFSAVFEADLVFFNGRAFRASCHPMPSTAEQVLSVTEEVRAMSCTSPAAALAEFYESAQAVDLFILISDEGENTAHKQLRFAEAFARYTRDVHREARCVFVSFLRDGEHGQMLRDMERLGFSPPQYRVDNARPDLTKFDALLGSVLLDAQQALERGARAIGAGRETERGVSQSGC